MSLEVILVSLGGLSQASDDLNPAKFAAFTHEFLNVVAPQLTVVPAPPLNETL